MKKGVNKGGKRGGILKDKLKLQIRISLIFWAVFLLVALIYFFGAKVRFDIAMAQGKLSKAERILPRINGYTGFYPSCAELVYEYAVVGNYDAANNVYDNIMNDEYRYSKLWWDLELMEDLCDRHCEKLTNKMYRYLMDKGEYDVAWHYHPDKGIHDNREFDADYYFSHVSSALRDMCLKGRKSEAQLYLNRSVVWFKVNVKSDSSEYNYENAKTNLQEILNMLQ